MIKAVIDFIKTHRHAVIWTLGYFACMWVILRVMFGFDMLSAHDWWRMTHAHIHGFAGFVFGILILAMLPMYVATTMVIARTREPLVKIPMPKLPAFLHRTTPATDTTPDADQTPDTPPAPQSFPANLPNELKPAFRRMRECGGGVKMPPAPCATTSGMATAPVADTGFPLPDSFDFDATATPGKSNDTPMFRDIDFDATAPAPEPDANPIPAPEIVDTDAPRDTAAIESYLDAAGRKFTRDGNIIIVDDMAIAAHCDSDFWIADTDTWFATGKSKASPIAALTAAAARGLHPVLYLGEQNIMDLDTLRDTWTAAGIRIITSPDEL